MDTNGQTRDLNNIVCRYLRDKIGPAKLEQWRTEDDAALQGKLVQVLNEIICTEPIGYTVQFTQRNTKIALVHHNRQLLQEAFPYWILADKDADRTSSSLLSLPNSIDFMVIQQGLATEDKQLLDLQRSEDAQLTRDHIPDPKAFTLKIHSSEDPLCRFLCNKIGPKRLSRWKDSSVSADELLRSLNSVIRQQSIWSEERFPDQNFSELREILVDTEPITLGGVNIQLLEKAFPRLVVSCAVTTVSTRHGGLQDRWDERIHGDQDSATYRRLYFLLRLYVRQAIWNASEHRSTWQWQSGQRLTDLQFRELLNMLEVPFAQLLEEATASGISLDHREAREFVEQCTARLLNKEQMYENNRSAFRNTYVDTPISRLRGLLKLVTPWLVP